MILLLFPVADLQAWRDTSDPSEHLRQERVSVREARTEAWGKLWIYALIAPGFLQAIVKRSINYFLFNSKVLTLHSEPCLFVSRDLAICLMMLRAGRDQ